MSNTPEDRSYTKEHEWARRSAGDSWVVGLTHFAQRQLGDVVYVELPAVGDTLGSNQPFGTVESVKAVSEIYMPFDGIVAKVNESLNDSPEQVNEDPYGDGWLVEITPSGAIAEDDLLTAAEYDDYVSQDQSE